MLHVRVPTDPAKIASHIIKQGSCGHGKAGKVMEFEKKDSQALRSYGKLEKCQKS